MTKSKTNKLDSWINKVRCTKRLEEQTTEAIEKSGETYPGYIRKAVEQKNEKVLKEQQNEI